MNNCKSHISHFAFKQMDDDKYTSTCHLSHHLRAKHATSAHVCIFNTYAQDRVSQGFDEGVCLHSLAMCEISLCIRSGVRANYKPYVNMLFCVTSLYT